MRERGRGELAAGHRRVRLVLSDAQARAHILCSRCEQRFNREGEDWVIENAFHNPGQFPLRTSLEQLGPFTSELGFRSFYVQPSNGIDLSKLVYFAASVVWRASVHDWRLGKAQTQRIQLYLLPRKTAAVSVG